VISIDYISKNYGAVKALQDVSFAVRKGELFGLIGPDGAGKTTLFRSLVTLLLPDSGTMTFDGHDVVKDYRYVRRNVGYMPGTFSLYQDLTVRENLEFFASVFQTTVEANYDLIKDIYVMLEPFAKRSDRCVERRHETEARAVVRVDPSAAGTRVGRTDHRCGCRESPRILGDAAQAEAGRHHHPGEHTVHGRSWAL
jgi:ABC-type Na+ transport system ATPase subunit NatA